MTAGSDRCREHQWQGSSNGDLTLHTILPRDKEGWGHGPWGHACGTDPHPLKDRGPHYTRTGQQTDQTTTKCQTEGYNSSAFQADALFNWILKMMVLFVKKILTQSLPSSTQGKSLCFYGTCCQSTLVLFLKKKLHNQFGSPVPIISPVGKGPTNFLKKTWKVSGKVLAGTIYLMSIPHHMTGWLEGACSHTK